MSKTKNKRDNWQAQLILTILVVAGVLFAPTTIILLCGMTPTIVAAYTDRSRERMRGITIGALNLAGCTPFVIQLWLSEHTIENALGMLSDPMTWMIMYAAAGVGYCLEWAIVSSVSIFYAEKAKLRIKSIEKLQDELVERWGKEVTGQIPLDEYGFALTEANEEKGKNGSK